MSGSSAIRRLFDEARQLPPHSRTRFLAEACADDDTRRHVQELIEALDANPDFLATPVVDRADVDRTLADVAREEIVPERIGRYRIIRLIGQGGMGTVYEAEQTSPRRPVALKVLRAAIRGERAKARFELEAEALGRLRHPGIAQIHEAGTADATDGPRPYFAMELVDGQPIDRHLRDEHPPLSRKLELIADVCDAIHHAHLHAVIHRDIKAGNVLVDADGRARVVDFGIAHLADAPLDASPAGTLGAMSPERLAGRDHADTRADIYALGALAYELLAGRPAYDLRDMGARQAAKLVAETEPQRLGSLDRHLRGDIEAVVAKAMAHDPDHRYQSAGQMADDIRRHLRDETVNARPATVLYQASSFVRRHRAASIGVLVGVATLTLGAAGTSIGMVSAMREQARTSIALANAERLIAALERILTSPDPRLLGRDATVTDLLDQAELSLKEEFLHSPLLAARIRHTIGKTYLALGRLDEAQKMLSLAYDSRRERLGPDDLQTLASAESLGRVLIARARFDEAEPLVRTAYEGQRRQLGETDRDTLASLHQLVRILDKSGRYDEADEYVSRLETLGAKALEPDDPILLAADNCRANLLAHRGDYEDAAKLHERTLDARRRVLGSRHPDTLQSLANLAAVLTELGDNARAAELLEEAFATSRVVLGEHHHETLSTAANLAAVIRRLGDDDRALELMTWTLHQHRATLGDTHLQTIISLANLAAFHARKGDFAQAEPLFDEAVTNAAIGLPASHPTLALLRVAHARSLVALGRPDDALASLDAAWAVLADPDAAGAAPRRQCADAFAQVYEATGQAARAASWHAIARDK